ncbi:MAG: S9 family peptidase, partial [Hyphomicrobiaceae bacterium]
RAGERPTPLGRTGLHNAALAGIWAFVFALLLQPPAEAFSIPARPMAGGGASEVGAIRIADRGRFRRAAPPRAKRVPVTVRHHGVGLTDDYGWLRTKKLEEVLKGPEALEKAIRRHLDAENRYARKMLDGNRDLERQLLAEMRGRASHHDDTVPDPRGPWEYYTRYDRGAERKLHCRRPRGGGAEQVLLDENVLAQGRREFSLEDTEMSPDHKLFAYSVDEDGSERTVLRIRDVVTGNVLPDVIPDMRESLVWSVDSRWLFYVRRDAVKWARSVYRHKLGTPVAEDRLVYEEAEEGFTVALKSTLSDRFLAIETSDFSTVELMLIDLADPTGPPRAVTGRKRGHKYEVADLGDRLIFFTNADGAINGKIAEKRVSAPANEGLQDIVPHRSGQVVEDFAVYRYDLVWLERDLERGTQRIVVRHWADGTEHALDFGDAPAKVALEGALEQDTRTVRYTYESLAQPQQVFDYDMGTRQRTLRKVRDVPSGHDPAHYATRRLEAPAPDGTRIPVTVLYHKDTVLDGSAPVWLYGYGAYGDSQHPGFGTERLSLVDRGFVYAIAHVRGGGEKGQAWHEAGRLAHKQNTFTDFIAAAEHLVASGMTRPGRIVAAGESAGGLLVGAAVNLRSGLFGAVHTNAPFVDVLNTMLDRGLPLTESSFSEFGNPIDSAADFAVIRSYAPYETVRAQAYPPMLVVQSLNDGRVPYWEAAKWVAKLRRMKTDGNPVMLLVTMRGGHSGGSGRFAELEYFARAYAFALQTVGRRERQ